MHTTAKGASDRHDRYLWKTKTRIWKKSQHVAHADTAARQRSQRPHARAGDTGVPMTGTELRTLRVQKGISQVGLARMLEVKPITVWRWEQGTGKNKRDISPQMARLITLLLGKVKSPENIP